MNVQPVSQMFFSKPAPVNNTYKKAKPAGFSSDVFVKNWTNPTFTGYQEILTNAASAAFKRESELEKAFNSLFSAIRKDKNIVKSEDFEVIAKIHDKKGFRGLLHDLWKANPSKELEPVIKKSEGNILTLAGTEKNPVMELINLGKHGFWNALTNNKTAPQEVHLRFTEKLPEDEPIIDFFLDKRQNCGLQQASKDTSVYSKYYSETGTIKQKSVHWSTCAPETTYYRKDGSEDELQNWLYGGPAVPMW